MAAIKAAQLGLKVQWINNIESRAPAESFVTLLIIIDGMRGEGSSFRGYLSKCWLYSFKGTHYTVAMVTLSSRCHDTGITEQFTLLSYG